MHACLTRHARFAPHRRLSQHNELTDALCDSRPAAPAGDVHSPWSVRGVWAMVTGAAMPTTRFRNILKRKSVSVGPAHASGWNCTEKMGCTWWMMPSLEPSLALTKSVFHPAGSESLSTA